MRILHAADFHLRDKNIDECEKCLGFILETAKNEKIDLTVIAGDTFDSRDIKLDSLSAKLVVKTISELADICPVVIVIGTPSHDGMAPVILNGLFTNRDDFPSLVVADKPMQICLHGKDLLLPIGEISNPMIVLSLLPQPTKQFFNQGDIQTSNEEIGKAMSGILAGFGAQAADYKCPHLLVYHGSISGAKLSTGQMLTGMDIEVSVDQLKLSNADLFLCGHIHLPQELTGNVFYSGSIYANNWGENHKHGFYIHEIKADKIKSQFIETPTRKLLRSEADFTTGDIRELDVVLYEYSPEELTGAFIRLDLTVWQDEAVKIDKEKIRGFYISGGAIDADIRIIRVPRQVVRSESVLKVESLRDKLAAMAAIKEETVPENILIKADGLESVPSEEVVKRAT